MRGDIAKTAVILVLIMFSLGCIEDPSFGEDIEYTEYWGSQHDVNYYLQENGHDITVINLTRQDELRFSMHSEWGGTNPLIMGGVSFRYRNGTVKEDIVVNESDGESVVSLPGEPGELAFATRGTSGYFEQKTPMPGGVRVVLPDNHDARNIFLGDITPGGYEVKQEDPVVIKWSDMEDDTRVIVDYYGDRDPLYLILLLVGMVIATLVVLIYFRREFDRSREDRLDLEDGLD